MEKTPLGFLGFRLRCRSLICAFLLAQTALAVPALAIEFQSQLGGQNAFEKTNLKAPPAPVSTKDPVVLTANQMDYDKDGSVVVARGNVEVSQGQTIVLCDSLTYDQAKNTVNARGNVSVLEASGNVFFADEMEFKDDLKAGAINQFKARLSDDSLFVAARAKRVNEDVTTLKKAVYSPCKVCADESGEGNAPLWQLRADKAVIDQEDQSVTYDNAAMELYGVPIFYTPYFSHPTPGADNKSGILEPQFKQSTNLGTVVKLPVYYTIAPDRDITLTPIYTSLEGPVVAGEYRQRFDAGSMTFSGSGTQPQTRDAGGFLDKGQNFRGHLNAKGDFQAGDHYGWGFDVKRTSDDTYLRRYGFSNETLLTSSVYGEGINFLGGEQQRSYGNVKALRFEGLTAADDSRRSPLVAPLAEMNWQSAPAQNGSRLWVDGNAMSLTRSEGTDSRRLSTTAGWKLPYISADGQVIELATQLRTDMYSVSDVVLPNGNTYNGETGRVIPQASVTWRYPFINHSENASLLIEPVVMVAVSPNSANSNKIPNEDSQVPEFNTSNLFAANRFAGYDEVETGPQAAYGLRGQAQLYSNKYIDWLVGQHYQRNNNASFPFSNDVNSQASDYVGKVGFNYDIFSLAYRTRLDKQTLSPKRNEVEAGFNYYPVGASVSYLALKNDPSLQTKEEISGTGTLNLTKEWQWLVAARRDIELNQLTGAATGLQFRNECIDVINTLGKEYTRDRDIKPATTYMLRVSLKNLD